MGQFRTEAGTSSTTAGEVAGTLETAAFSPSGGQQPLIWGARERPLDRIVVTWSAGIEFLEEVAATGPALIVTRVHPFFEAPQLWDPAILSGVELSGGATLEPVSRKHRLLEESGIILVFAPVAWGGSPADRSRALADRIGLGTPVAAHEDGGVVVDIPSPLLARDLARTAARVAGRSYALVTGGLERSLSRFGVVAGIASPPTIMHLAGAGAGELLIIGSTVEWEGLPYAQDSTSAGRPVTLVAIGNQASEDPAGERLAARLGEVYPGVHVEWRPTPDATWIPIPEEVGR